MEKNLVNSPFVRPSDRPEYKGVAAGAKEYLDLKIYLKYVETGTDESGKSIGSVQPVVVESRTDIDKLINSHAKEVGLKNLISLYLRTGDATLFNQKQSINSVAGSDGFVDITSLPDKTAQEIFDQDIPAALKGDKNMEAFLKTLTKEQFQKFIASLMSAPDNSSSNEGGNQDE